MHQEPVLHPQSVAVATEGISSQTDAFHILEMRWEPRQPVVINVEELEIPHEVQEVLRQLLDVVGGQLEVVEVLEIGQLVQCLDGVVLQPQLSGVGRYARR